MNVLITGATGFIGSYLTKELYRQGYHCRCLVRNIDKAKEIFKDYKDIEFVVGNVARPDSLKNIANDIDIVFHLVALMGHDLPSEQAFRKFRSINVEGVRNIVEECKKSESIKKIIHFSSTAIYGILKKNFIDERTVGNPYTPYQISKYEGEQLALYYYKSYKLPIVVLRPSMIYGPGFKGDFFTMAKLAKKGIYPKIGKRKNLAPALYIDDLIKGCIAALEKGKSGEIYLLGSIRSYSQDEIVGIFEIFFGRKVFRFFSPVWLAKAIISTQESIFKVAKKNPIVTVRNISSIATDRILDISKAKEDLGFNPIISLEEGLLNTLKWYRKENLI